VSSCWWRSPGREGIAITAQVLDIIDQEGDPQLLVDERGCIGDANPAACRLLARPHRHLIGKPFVLYVDHDLRPEYFDLLRRALHGQTQGEVIRGRLRPPAAAPVEIELAILPLEEASSGAMLSLSRAERSPLATALLEQERRHREMLVAVTEALRPRPLTFDGVDLAYEVHTPDAVSRLGGDLCDWLELPSGELHLAVIDAEGQGALALGIALTVVSTLRTLAAMNCPIAEMVPRAEQLVRQQEPSFTAAVTVVRYDPGSERLQISHAGDPPPLLLRRSGSVERLGDSSRPLGYPGKPRPHVTQVSLGAGDLVLVYTDGLLIGHPTPLAGVAAMERRLQHLHHLGVHLQSAGDFAGRVFADVSEGDDALVAVLRRGPSPALVTSEPDGETFHASLRPSAGSELDSVRHRLRRWADQHPLTWQAMHDLLLVVTELGENAIVAARSRVEIEVRCCDDGTLAVEVVDDGPGLRESDLWGSTEGRGYGLHIVELICTELQVVPSAGGTVVRGRLRADTGR
jgi:anti-sigma regulatory factor (Ser/Thr protein kinase)